MRDAIAAVYPENPTPVRLIEYLTNEGLRLISLNPPKPAA
jgi:hypothetical protein